MARRKASGSIVVDSDNHYLYLVQKDGKAIRYGITVGEEAMAWSGIAKVGSKTEWPPWHPTKSEISRLGVPTYVAPGPDNPMGSRALYLYSGGKDTLFRIHGTNQPEYIGASISSGCIRMTNEDVIDLYDRVGVGARAVRYAEEEGLIVRFLLGDVVSICPPLIIAPAEIDELFDRLERALDRTLAWAKHERLIDG